MAQNLLIQRSVLQGIGNRNCFITLPQKWASIIKTCSLPTFQVESARTSAIIICNWAGDVHSNDDEIIYINDILIKSNGFEEGEEVYVSQLETPSQCLSMFAELNSITDWDNLIMNYKNIQSSMLDQVRVVQIGKIIPLWLEGGCLLLLKITEFPNSTCSLHILADSTIVNIEPPKNTSVSNINTSNNSPPKSLSAGNHNEPPCNIDVFGLIKTAIKRSFSHVYDSDFPIKSYIYEVLSLRSFPANICNTVLEFLKKHPSLVIVSKNIVINSAYENSKWFATNIEQVKTDLLHSEKIKTVQRTKVPSTICLVIVWENFSLDTILSVADNRAIMDVISSTSCIMCDHLWNSLGLSCSDIIQLNTENVEVLNEKATIDVGSLLNLEISTDIFISTVRTFLKSICEICPIILSHIFTVIPVPNSDQRLEAFLLLRNKTAVLIDHVSISLASFNFISKPTNITCPPLDGNQIIPQVIETEVILYKEFFNNLVSQIKSSLVSLDLKPCFFLLEGDERSGKTVISHKIINHFKGSVYCKLHRLKLLKGKKSDTLQKKLIKDIHICLLNQPSILILDDIDHLSPSELLANQDGGPVYEYNMQLSVMLRNIFSQLSKTCSSRQFDDDQKIKFTILATCKSRSHMHSVLSAPNGHNLFPSVFKIPPLSWDDKLNFLLKCINASCANPNAECQMQLNPIHLSNSNDHVKSIIQALSLSELESLSRRVVVEAKTRSLITSKNYPNLMVCEEDFVNACKDMIPLSVKGINKQSKKGETSDIGGLALPQKIIQQSILWPLRHPQIFKQVGLSVRTGILLYGPPGCGKTLLANSIAASCNMNFIFVKGPELLSKYIGQSEKSVRDLFSRGRNASPCIVFFDEFDALAPRRGHDNTGVTDRVVNQLLTQMDGVEGNEGVFVLAATSRPDLIDPALLRPGRLDKPVYCAMPDKTERSQIFEALSKHLPLGESMDWDDCAGLTSQFTGADIQGVFSTAQVLAAREVLGERLYKGLNLSKTSVVPDKLSHPNENIDGSFNIRRKHILEAIQNTTRSISTVQMKKYHDIYQKFGAGDKSLDVVPGSKYTLA